MGRRVFISVLGTGNYQECIYQSSDKAVSVQTCFAQEAALRYVDAPNWDPADQVFILLTEDARQRNWDKLSQCLGSLGLHCPVKDIPIVDGKDEKEVWAIFKTIYDLIEDGDNLYFDVTHALRYLPMLVLVMGSYTFFLKNTTVNKIVYGNWEMRDKESNAAPLMDLTILNELQRWSFAVGSYVRNGSTTDLMDLSVKQINDIRKNREDDRNDASALKSFISDFNTIIEDRRTCRGPEIYNGDHVMSVKSQVDSLKGELLPAFSPLIDRIGSSLDAYRSNELMNNYESARWCFDSGLYIEAETTLVEGVTTRLHLDLSIDWLNHDLRTDVNRAIQRYVGNDDDKKKDDSPFVKELADQIEKLNYPELKSAFSGATQFRNDLNHGGWRGNNGDQALASKKIRKKVDALINDLRPFFERPLKAGKPSLFANYSGLSIRDMDQDSIRRILDAGFYVEFSLPKKSDENALNRNVKSQLEKIQRLNLGISPEDTLVYFGECDEIKLYFKEILKQQGYRVTETLPEKNLSSPEKD